MADATAELGVDRVIEDLSRQEIARVTLDDEDDIDDVE